MKRRKNTSKNNQPSSPRRDMRTYALLRSGTRHSLHRWMEVGGASVAAPEPVYQLGDVPQRDVNSKGAGSWLLTAGFP